MKGAVRTAAVCAFLTLLVGTTAAKCTEGEEHDASNAVHAAAIDLGHEKVTVSGRTLAGIRSDVGASGSADALAGDIENSQVHETLNTVTEHLDADTANDVIEAACNAEGLNQKAPPSPPPLLEEAGAKNALQTAQNSDPSEQFAARAICAAAADLDAYKQAGGS